MQIIQKEISDLIPYVNNARTHSDGQIAKIASSIKEFGFTNPLLVDENYDLIAGHCRLDAAKQLGFDVIPCIVLSHLTQEQRTAVESACGKSSIAVVQGRAGTGKTTMLSAVKEAYEQQGYNVQGIAFTGQAA